MLFNDLNYNQQNYFYDDSLKIENNLFFSQISNNEFPILNQNTNQECYSFQGYYQKEQDKDKKNEINKDLNLKNKIKTKGSFKNIYINKINHLMKNIKKQHLHDKQTHTK